MKILKRKRMLQKMTKKTLPILYIAFMTATAFAFSVNRMTWQISDTVTNAYLYERLAKIEQLAKKYITVDNEDMIVVLDDNRKVPVPETTVAPETAEDDGTSSDTAEETAETAETAYAETFETEPPLNVAETSPEG